VSCGKKQQSWEELNDAAVKALGAGRSVEAEGHLLAALEMARRDEQLAQRIPVSLHRLARFYEARQRYSQAAETYAAALDVDSKRLRVDDPALYDTVKRLATMREISEQATEAKEVYKRFLAMQEAQLGHDALPIASTLVQIGRLARMRSGYDEAETAFQRALSIRIRHLGQDNDLLPEVLDEYVILLRDTEQPYKADLMEERSARLRMNRTARRMNDAAGN
jgi:tetratricopeptide (TPR) repeat protein